jgi:hypothetical protein
MVIQHCKIPTQAATQGSGYLISSPSYGSPNAVHYLITDALLKSRYGKPSGNECRVLVGLSQAAREFKIIPNDVSTDGSLANPPMEIFKIEFVSN